MSSPANSPSLRILLGVVASVIIFIYLIRDPSPAATSGPSSSSSSMANPSAGGPVAGLLVSLKQTKTAPPTITITVENKNSEPVTIVSYNSPLDPLVIQLGLLFITPAGSENPLGIDTLQINRLWPPPADALITIAAGESAQNEVILREPVVPMNKVGAKAKVQLKGHWMSVWAKEKDSVNSEHDESFSGEFSSDEIEVTTS